MGFLDWLSGRAVVLAEELQDAGRAALYVRQLLRGNRSAARCEPVGASMAPPERLVRDRNSASSPSPRREADGDGTPPTPVLLVHGYFATRGSLHLLEQRLGDRGRVVLSYRFGPLHLGGIRDSAARIGRKVEALCAQTSVEKIDLVGHSMGGLAGLYYLKHLGGHLRIRKLVLLGSPVAGTWTAVFGLPTAPLGPGSLDLLPRSAVLDELRTGGVPASVEVTTIAGSRDFVAPPRATILSGARSVVLPTTHAGLLVDPQVADVLGDVLCGPRDEASPEDGVRQWAEPATL